MTPSLQIASWVELARISQFLSADSNGLKRVTQWGVDKGNKSLPFLLGFFSDVAEWGNNNGVNVDKSAMYMYSLCGKYINVVQNTIGSPSGVIVNPSTGIISTILAQIMQFKIGSGVTPIDPDTGNPITVGGVKFIIPYTFVLQNSVQVILDQSPLQLYQTDKISISNIVYTNSEVAVTLNQGVIDGQIYDVTLLRYNN